MDLDTIIGFIIFTALLASVAAGAYYIGYLRGQRKYNA